MLCLRDGAGDHGRLNDEHHLSLQRSPIPAVMSILPVGPPPCFRRAPAAHWLITLSKARRDGLSRFFDPLGETVRGPSPAVWRLRFATGHTPTERLQKHASVAAAATRTRTQRHFQKGEANRISNDRTAPCGRCVRRARGNRNRNGFKQGFRFNVKLVLNQII